MDKVKFVMCIFKNKYSKTDNEREEKNKTKQKKPTLSENALAKIWFMGLDGTSNYCDI